MPACEQAAEELINRCGGSEVDLFDLCSEGIEDGVLGGCVGFVWCVCH